MQGTITAETLRLRAELKLKRAAADHWLKKAHEVHNNLVQLQAKADLYADLLNRVAANFTRDDDLPDNLLPEIDAALEDLMVTVSELGEGQENHCPHCGAEPGQMCSTREGREYGAKVHEARQTNDSPTFMGEPVLPKRHPEYDVLVAIARCVPIQYQHPEGHWNDCDPGPKPLWSLQQGRALRVKPPPDVSPTQGWIEP